jgi:hypothetical protein
LSHHNQYLENVKKHRTTPKTTKSLSVEHNKLTKNKIYGTRNHPNTTVSAKNLSNTQPGYGAYTGSHKLGLKHKIKGPDGKIVEENIYA